MHGQNLTSLSRPIARSIADGVSVPSWHAEPPDAERVTATRWRISAPRTPRKLMENNQTKLDLSICDVPSMKPIDTWLRECSVKDVMDHHSQQRSREGAGTLAFLSGDRGLFLNVPPSHPLPVVRAHTRWMENGWRKWEREWEEIYKIKPIREYDGEREREMEMDEEFEIGRKRGR